MSFLLEWTADFWLVQLTKDTALVIVIIATLGITLNGFILEHNTRKVIIGILPAVWFGLLLSLMYYFPKSASWMESHDGRTFLIVGLILSYLLYIITRLLLVKKDKKISE
ncbi:hypothetical protein [Marinilactibacillus piezotolerans]|uniref:hypothetical protein n=1 Tax=Marinilactibacillus piezotolerans TaxID=258723 RepID=UPI0009AF7910|nr:hypothetical protein [Marinilactibacillus piezotolerans]